MTATRCRSCPAAVIWAITTTGKKMPLNATPDQTGGQWVIRNGVAIHLPYGPQLQQAMRDDEALYLPHWATCPEAPQWKGRRR